MKKGMRVKIREDKYKQKELSISPAVPFEYGMKNFYLVATVPIIIETVEKSITYTK